MRKGEIFMPMMAIGILIVMSVMMFNIYKHKENVQESFVVGELQSQIVKNYLESEKEFFYYEKLLEYNEYKAVKEFSRNGAVKESCNKRWKFNDECEPEFRDYFKDVLTNKLDNKYKSLSINSEIESYFTDFIFSPKSNTTEVDYSGRIIIKKHPLIDFNDLEELKSKIKECIQSKDMAKCSPQSSSGTVYKFRKKTADILNENLEKEEVYLEFEINTEDSGLRTSIF